MFIAFFGASLCLTLVACGSPEDRAEAYYKHGQELLAKGDPVKASLEFRNALKLKPNFVPARFSLGQIDEQNGNFESAVRSFLSVSERSPEDIQSRLHLAAILSAVGQLANAAKFADEAYALAKSNPEVL